MYNADVEEYADVAGGGGGGGVGFADRYTNRKFSSLSMPKRMLYCSSESLKVFHGIHVTTALCLDISNETFKLTECHSEDF